MVYMIEGDIILLSQTALKDLKHWESPIMGPSREVICKLKNWMMTRLMTKVMRKAMTRVMSMAANP